MSSPTAASSPLPFRVQGLGVWLLLVVLVTFAGVYRCGWVNYDDDLYVTANPHVQAGLTWTSVQWALTSGEAKNWHPLTWCSLLLDRTLWGHRPFAFHMVNLGLHALTALALYNLLLLYTGARWRSALVAAVWAVHPLRVESVAWVAERKDVLCGWLALLTLHAYWHYVHQPRRGRYLALLGLFTLALLAKPMAVTLPLIMLLLDYWPLQRWPRTRTAARACLREKLPLLLLALASGIITVVVQAQGHAVRSVAAVSLTLRATNALVAYARYLGKLLWPTDLAVLYPLPAHWPLATVALAAALLVALSALVWQQRRARPWLLVGWLWFVVMLLPVIGLLQVGQQAMADRYTYLPSIGLLIALVWSLPTCPSPAWRRPVRGAMAILLLLALAITTRAQIRTWQDSGTLWRHTLAATQDNAVAHLNYSAWLLAEPQDGATALAHARSAVDLAPTLPAAWYVLGTCLAASRKYAEATAAYQLALSLQSDYPQAEFNLGLVLLQTGDASAAVAHLQRAVLLAPEDAEAHRLLAQAYHRRGQRAQAAAEERAAGQ